MIKVFFLSLFIIFLDAKSIDLTKEQKEYLKTKQYITVHNEKNWAPYNFNQDGKPKGFMIDYMDLIAKKLDIKVKYISGYSWSEFLDLIKENKIDVIANIAKTKDREKYIEFTKPFIESKKAIFSNQPNIRKISDLNGKRVAVVNKFFIHEYLQKNYPKIKIKTYKNIKECLYAIINKEVDALIENYAVVNYQIIKNGLVIKYIAITDDKELKTNISLGVSKKDYILKEILQKAQDSISKEEFEELENRWFGVINKIVLETKGITIYDKILLTNNTKSNKTSTKLIKMCVDPNWMPFEKIDKNGNYIGIISDYLKVISKKSNIEFKLVKTNNFKQSIQYLRENRCNIIMAEVATSERKKEFLATKPYIVVPRAYVTHKDIPWVSDFSYLLKKDNKVGVLADSPAKVVLKNRYKNITLIEYKTIQDGLKAVSSKEVIAFVSIMPSIAYEMKKNIFNDIKIAGYIKKDVALSILLNKNYSQLLPLLNSAIDDITEQEKFDILSKWIDVKFENQVDYKYFWQIIGVLLFILVIGFYINYRLKIKINEEVEKNKQQQLLMLQQSRLAQMGEMISMIAHQWRQPLNSLSMLNQSIVFKYNRGKLDDKFIEYFKTNSKIQIQSMSKTIDDFRDFFKPQKERVEFFIDDIVDDTIQMLKPVFSTHNIKLILDKKDNYISFTGYPNELGQAILNIINNSKDALLEQNIENKEIKLTLEKTDKNIIIVIEDNAKGIPEDIIDNIFDPYFSTKEEKNGTGLGLYMTRIIIYEHLYGKIEVKNSDKGAVFKVIL